MLAYATSRDKVKAIRQVVQTLCIFYFEDITSRELDVLCEIVHAGEVGMDAKKSFMMNYKCSKESYFQVLDRLTKKGILQKKQWKTGKEIHSYFRDIIGIVNGNMSEHTFEIKVGDKQLMAIPDRFIVLQYQGNP